MEHRRSIHEVKQIHARCFMAGRCKRTINKFNTYSKLNFPFFYFKTCFESPLASLAQQIDPNVTCVEGSAAGQPVMC